MKRYRIIFRRRIPEVYFWGTVIGAILLFLSDVLAPLSLTLGANSIYLALTNCGFSESQSLAVFSLVWFAVYPMVLVIAYLLAGKRNNVVLLHIAMLADLLFVAIYAITALAQSNMYAFWMVIPDLAISIVLWLLFCFATMECKESE